MSAARSHPPAYDPRPGMLVVAKREMLAGWEAACPNQFKKGHIYTIREAGLLVPEAPEYVFVRLVEIINPPFHFTGIDRTMECPFLAQLFHPVDPKRIALVKSMLVGARESEAA